MAGLETLLPASGALGTFAVIVAVLLRFLSHDRKQLAEADRRYADEVRAHEATQARLDEERDHRRHLEDRFAELTRELAGVKQQVAHQTQRIADQTEHIRRLESQVRQLTGSPT